jgi:hypothetical protein
VPTRTRTFDPKIAHREIAEVFDHDDRPVSARGGGDQGVCSMNRSTTRDLSLTTTCSHHRLAHGLDEAEAAEEVGGCGLSFLRPDPSPDLTVAALEDETRRLAVGVLRDPGGREDAALVEALVDEARRHGEGRPR